ncbi:MAG: hypothetical protein WCF90_07560 [Methanomicrobiales archaeon]
MQTHHPTLVPCQFTLACPFIIPMVSAASIQASVGDISSLSGYSYGSQTVYLFLTGSNLPVNGVALIGITKHADQSYFTVCRWTEMITGVTNGVRETSGGG